MSRKSVLPSCRLLPTLLPSPSSKFIKRSSSPEDEDVLLVKQSQTDRKVETGRTNDMTASMKPDTVTSESGR